MLYDSYCAIRAIFKSVVFIVQQAYGENLYETSDWDGLEGLLDHIISLTGLSEREKS